jgi:hypothetical protein
MNPYWHDYQTFKRSPGDYADAAIACIVFGARLKALIVICREQALLGNVNPLVWRIEYQQRGLPHAYILFWMDFDTDHLS